jgi:mono/diheme cytochrome c family protein
MRLLLVLLLVAQGAWAQGSPERGKKLYQDQWCHSCHGTVGQGGDRGAGPKLAPNPFPYEAFAHQVRRPRSSMPRYAPEFLSEAELADIYAYVGSIKAGPAAKDIPALRD